MASELSGLVKMVEAGSRPPNFFQFKCVLMFQIILCFITLLNLLKGGSMNVFVLCFSYMFNENEKYAPVHRKE